MKQFKVGDRVVRTTPFLATYDGGFMQEGNEYVIQDVFEDGNVTVEGGDRYYSGSYFQFVQPTFKAMKFKVTSPEQSKEIQEALFSMGYEWNRAGKQILNFQFVDIKVIVTDEFGIMKYAEFGDAFKMQKELEYTIKTKNPMNLFLWKFQKKKQ